MLGSLKLFDSVDEEKEDICFADNKTNLSHEFFKKSKMSKLTVWSNISNVNFSIYCFNTMGNFKISMSPAARMFESLCHAKNEIKLGFESAASNNMPETGNAFVFVCLLLN